MNKTQMIHDLIDKLMEIADSETAKQLSFSYLDGIGFDFHFTEYLGSKEMVEGMTHVYMNDRWDADKQMTLAFDKIEKIKNTPDVEPKITIEMTQKKAKELGLV